MTTHRTRVLKRYGLALNESHSLQELSEHSGYSVKDLKTVYERGRGAWKSNPESVRLKSDFSKNPDMRRYPRSARLSAEQWGFARVYSFIDKGTTFHTADADIARKYS